MNTLIRDIEAINQKKIIDTIRCLGIDMIHEANSGHPGIVLGAAPIIYSVYAHNLRFDKDHPDYFNKLLLFGDFWILFISCRESRLRVSCCLGWESEVKIMAPPGAVSQI